jgi:hypothetical protein
MDRMELISRLEALGVDVAEARYNGSGDSGCVEEVRAIAWSGITIDLPQEERSAIEDEAYNFLEESYPGWEINDGSMGQFRLNVPRRSVTLEHNEYSTEYCETQNLFIHGVPVCTCPTLVNGHLPNCALEEPPMVFLPPTDAEGDA